MFLWLGLQEKGQEYFISSSYMFLDEKPFIKIRLNLGLNFGTGFEDRALVEINNLLIIT